MRLDPALEDVRRMEERGGSWRKGVEGREWHLVSKQERQGKGSDGRKN